jgi:hypothetical protein
MSDGEYGEPSGLRGFKERYPAFFNLAVGAFVIVTIFLLLFCTTYVTCARSGASFNGMLKCADVKVLGACDIGGKLYNLPEGELPGLKP